MERLYFPLLVSSIADHNGRIQLLKLSDILMVWHAFLLNPSDYKEFCTRHQLDRIQEVPFPWPVIVSWHKGLNCDTNMLNNYCHAARLYRPNQLVINPPQREQTMARIYSKHNNRPSYQSHRYYQQNPVYTKPNKPKNHPINIPRKRSPPAQRSPPNELHRPDARLSLDSLSRCRRDTRERSKTLQQLR